MMKLKLAGIGALAVALNFSVTVASAAEHENLKAFPAAAEGKERFVIALPHKERGEEDAFRVELVVGKIMETDGVNSVGLGAEIKAKPLEGWGFTYYEVEKVGPAMSTLIGVPPDTPKVEKFVSGQPLQIGYNSRVPIVIYVPAGCVVRYRIWTAGEELLEAEKG